MIEIDNLRNLVLVEMRACVKRHPTLRLQLVVALVRVRLFEALTQLLPSLDKQAIVDGLREVTRLEGERIEVDCDALLRVLNACAPTDPSALAPVLDTR